MNHLAPFSLVGQLKLSRCSFIRRAWHRSQFAGKSFDGEAPRRSARERQLPRCEDRRGSFRFLTLIALLAFSITARASEYGVAKTFWSFAGTWTNSPLVATNLNAGGDFTTCTDFALQIVAYPTNNSVGAGSFDIVWETSLDNANFPKATNLLGRTTGWFSAPFQSNSLCSVWVTNISADAIGYWRIRHVTNRCNMNFTNIQIRAYTKPRRNG